MNWYVEEALTLYVEQLAWLHSTPKDAKKPRIETISEASFPDIGYGRHLINLLQSFAKVSYAEILSRDEIALRDNPRHKPLSLWESETIVKLRRSYDNMYSKSSNTHHAAPYINVEHETELALKNQDAMWDAMWASATDGSGK